MDDNECHRAAMEPKYDSQVDVIGRKALKDDFDVSFCFNLTLITHSEDIANNQEL
jgi:hypothetical protein